MAIRKPPRRNLPADAEKWGRYTDDALRQAQVDIESLRRDLTSGFRATNSSLSRVVKQQTDLAQQQTDLAQQQLQILDLLDTQTTVSANSASTSGLATTNTNWGTKASTSFSFPNWVSQAVIIGSAAIKSRINLNGEGEDSQLYLRVNINGVSAGGDIVGYPIPEGNGSYSTSLSTTWAALVSVGSSNTTVTCQAHSGRSVWYPANNANTASISAVAIGLR